MLALAQVRLGRLGEERSEMGRVKEEGLVEEVKERIGVWRERGGEGEVEVEGLEELEEGWKLHSLGIAVSASPSTL